jgi:hypothetical protein
MKINYRSKALILFSLFFFSHFSFSQSWQSISSFGAPWPSLNNGLSFASKNVGFTYYSLGNPYGGGAHGAEYRLNKSLDCMQTFGQIRYVSGSMGCTSLGYLHFFNRDTGIIGEACQLNLNFFKTVDGGLTWQAMGSAAMQPSFSITFVSPDVGFYTIKSINDDESSLYRHGNPNPLLRSFKYDFINDNVHKTHVHFVSDSVGFITCRDTSNNGVVLKTVDMGISWTEIINLPGANFNALDFYSETEGVIVGDNGLVVRINDAGQNWSIITFPTTAKLNTISFGNDSLGYLGGDGGTLFMTNNGGITWTLDPTWNLSTNIQKVKDFDGVVYASSMNQILRKGAGCVYSNYKEIEEEGNLHIYPNPTSGSLTIELPEQSEDFKLYIMDINGTLIKESNSLIVSTYDLPSGIYLLQVKTDKKNYKAKFVKI